VRWLDGTSPSSSQTLPTGRTIGHCTSWEFRRSTSNSALASVETRPRPQALAAAADLLGCDSRVRRGVLQALDHGGTEVTLWGETCPAELDSSVGPVQHRLSMAAQIFKAQALAAALNDGGAPASSIGLTETFRSGLMACPSVAADLVPAS